MVNWLDATARLFWWEFGFTNDMKRHGDCLLLS